MTIAAIPARIVRPVLALAAIVAGFDSAGDAQIVVHERITIRVPRMTGAPLQRVVSPQRDWKEHKGPKCLGVNEMVAAAITEPAAVDLLTADGHWMRARLDGDCRSADFYAGLYIRPGADGRICAGRDAIRVRSGGRCPIDSFRRLAPRR